MNEKLKNLVPLFEILISVFLVVMIFFSQKSEEFGLYFNGLSRFIPIILYSILVILLIIESITFQTLTTIRIVYNILEMIIILLMAFNYKSFASINGPICLLAIPYSVIMIFVLKKSSKNNIKNNNHPKNKKLPINIFSRKQLIINNLGFLNLILLAFIAIILSKVFNISHFFFYLIFIIIGFVIWLYLAYKYNPLNNILKTINVNLSYKTFKEEINILMNNNLDNESLNYLNILLLNYSMTYDLEESKLYFEKCYMPKYKQYKQFYITIMICYYININDIDNAKLFINQLNTLKKNMNLSLSYLRLISVLLSKEEIDNIESYYPLENKFIFSSAVNCFTLMQYYNIRENKEKSVYYANKLLEHDCDFKLYKDTAQSILDNIT